MSASHNPYLHASPPPTSEDVKAAYDDLLTHHSTYVVGTPLSQQGHYKSKHDDPNDPAPYAYPPPLPTKEIEPDPPSFWEKILPESMACRLYVATVLIETTIDLAIEGDLYLRVREKVKEDLNNDAAQRMSTSRMQVYLSIFALAHVFQFVMAVDAVYARNTLQFIFLTMFNALFLLYAIIQIKEIQETVSGSAGGISTIPINVLTTIIPIVISIAEIAYIGLGWKIFHEFGWKVYKFIGADRRIKKMYATYQVYECLVKFDVFFWAGFSVQFIWLVLEDDDWEYYVTCAALPLSLVLLVEGHLAARHENKWMMATFMSGCVGAMIYFIYKLVKVLLLREREEYKLVWKTLTCFSVIAIVLLVATFVYSVVVLRNFGLGLKDALARRGQANVEGNHRRAASTNLNRMSIE